MIVASIETWGGLKTRIVLAAFFMAIFAVTNAVAGEIERWEVTMIKGHVTANGASALSAGNMVIPGTSIVTGSDGKVVLSRNGDSVTVFPSSKMTVPYPRDDEETGILQDFGRLLFRMESRDSRDFKVQTPYLAAAIMGTTFTVSVNTHGAEVAVSEGSVQVTALNSGYTILVGAGMTASAGDDDEMVRVSALGGNIGGGAASEPDSSDRK